MYFHYVHYLYYNDSVLITPLARDIMLRLACVNKPSLTPSH